MFESILSSKFLTDKKSNSSLALKTWLLSLIRACAHCSRLAGSTDLLCRRCWQASQQLIKFSVKRDPHSSVISFHLYSWRKQKIISDMIYGLKQGVCKKAWQNLAEVFVQHYQLEIGLQHLERPLFLPAPGEHANVFAQELARQTKSPVQKIFCKKINQHQKQKSRTKRYYLELELMEAIAEGEWTHLILVDDVKTTGATLRAMHKLLPKKIPVEAWTLAHRPIQGLCT